MSTQKKIERKYIDHNQYQKTTIDSYNKNAKELAEKFKGLMDLNRRYEFQRFMELLKSKDKNKFNRQKQAKILDLGCGSGDHSLYFKEKGADVVSIDLSEEMIKICMEKGLNKLNTFLMDIEHLQFDDNSFDGIWAVTSLLHVPKPKLPEVIKNLNRILKKDGILFVCVKEGKGEEMIEDRFGKRFFAFWEEEELKKIFSAYFTLIEIKRVQRKNTVFLQAFFKKR